MPNREAKQPQIQLDKLGGLNERPALNATPSPDFPVLHALYQRRAGSLQRLEGTRVLASLPTGILGGAQIDDSTGNVIVQGENGSEYLYTLAELFGRTVVSNLNYTPLPPDEDMATAIIIQDAANATGGPNITSIGNNTFATRSLTLNPLNEDTIIVAFVSGASGSFEVAAGTYRIRGYAMFWASVTMGAGTGSAQCRAGFQLAISDTTTSATLTMSNPAMTELSQPLTATQTWSSGNVICEVDYTFTIAGPANSVLQVKHAYVTLESHTGTSLPTFAIICGDQSNITGTLNGAALRQPYMVLNLSKVA